MPFKHLQFSLECYQHYVNEKFFHFMCKGNPSVRGVMLALKSQYMQYNFRTFQVAVVLDGVRGSAVG
jgi:hypothetical protein